MRLASNGDTLWTHTFPGVHGEGGVFSSVRMLPDHGFLLGGTDDACSGEGWIVQTDSLGNLVWQGAWGDITEQNWDHVVCAQPTEDGGCIAFGSTYTYATPSFDAWMLKVDSLCVASVSELPAAAPTAARAATIVRGVLWLPLDPSIGHQASCCLLDISGRKVLPLEPGANDLSWLTPGVYFLGQDGYAPATKVILQR